MGLLSLCCDFLGSFGYGFYNSYNNGVKEIASWMVQFTAVIKEYVPLLPRRTIDCLLLSWGIAQLPSQDSWFIKGIHKAKKLIWSLTELQAIIILLH